MDPETQWPGFLSALLARPRGLADSLTAASLPLPCEAGSPSSILVTSPHEGWREHEGENAESGEPWVGEWDSFRKGPAPSR